MVPQIPDTKFENIGILGAGAGDEGKRTKWNQKLKAGIYLPLLSHLESTHFVANKQRWELSIAENAFA